jgi:hypothetical protein
MPVVELWEENPTELTLEEGPSEEVEGPLTSSFYRDGVTRFLGHKCLVIIQ